MGKLDLGVNLAKEVSAYMRTGGRSLLQTRPVGKINIEGLKYAPQLEGDVVQFSNQCENLITKNSLSDKTNNSILSKCVKWFSEKYNVYSKQRYLSANGFPKLKYSMVKKFLSENPNTDLKDFCMYAKGIDFNQLEKLVPEIKNFKSFNKLHFTNYHYKQRKTNFTIEDLQFKQDLTQYLKENYTNADDMLKIYSAFPAISREVGTLPNDWIKLLNTTNIKVNEKLIYNCIDNFRVSGKTKIFKEELSKILGQTVSMQKIGKGSHGSAYKISTKNSKDICLKIFHNYGVDNRIVNAHGQYVELQNGLFANSHSDNFAHVYFGRVGVIGKSDGFMVTQYIEKGVKPEFNKISKKASSYIINIADDYKSNYKIIDGKKIYIDFGAMEVKNNTTR